MTATGPVHRRSFLRRTSAVLAATATGEVLSAAPAAASKRKRPIRKGVKIGMLPKKLSDREKFALARRCGFDGIDGVPIQDLKIAAEKAKLAREVGAPFHGIVYGWWPPFTNTDPAVVRKSIAAMEHALRCARAMQVDTVLLVPTRVTENFSYADAYKRSQEYIHKLIPTAEETGVIIAVENVWNKFLLSPLEFARYLDELNSKWVRAYFDIGNVIIYGFSQHWIRILGSRIVKLDVKDFKRQGYQWKNLLEGDVNFPEVMKALDEIGYRGWMTAEVRGGDEAYLTDLAGRMDKIIAL